MEADNVPASKVKILQDTGVKLLERVPELSILVVLCVIFLYSQDRTATVFQKTVENLNSATITRLHQRDEVITNMYANTEKLSQEMMKALADNGKIIGENTTMMRRVAEQLDKK